MSININPIETYVPTIYVNNSEPDLDETNLNHAEQALKRVTDAANAAILALESLDSAKIDAAKIVNNLLATDTSTVLSGPMGKALGDRLTAAENLLTRLNSEIKISYRSSEVTTEWLIKNPVSIGILTKAVPGFDFPLEYTWFFIAISDGWGAGMLVFPYGQAGSNLVIGQYDKASLKWRWTIK
ncbi:hypothetical protein PMZ83_16805 [[Clostridium] symbiosum]|uniref:hypothetical protein n=1 Tax=Clostridium symbiosum TaxID=1512 RepID=UPI00232C85D9|nr:hypothetical protein [[Clostridium] symbiosum]MDB1979295.1 hypothetical protein [[Clostridium] symbiosum]